MSIVSPQSLFDALSRHAKERPDAQAYTFLEDGVVETESVTFYDLHKDVRAIARGLSERVASGARALLVYPSGLDFIRAFLGSLYAGIICVPIHVPRSRHHLDRLAGIIADADAELLLTTESFYARLHELFGNETSRVRGTWIFTEQLKNGDFSALPTWNDETLAFLQYTSGSTSSPKGVMVSHRNIRSNQELIREAFGTDSKSIVVSWLPHYHDMGLIGGILHPLWVGARCVLMPPSSFLRNPTSWLNTISRYRATTSGGPNFAYELCAEKISEEQKAGLDLSSWKLAFNGAETIRPRTIERFVEAFEKAGFSRRAMTPCYGLAEATLFVSSKRNGCEYSLVDSRTRWDGQELRNRLQASRNSQPIVSCGAVGKELQVRIVDPETHAELPKTRVGEILLAGPSVAEGYWRNAAATAETFHQTVNGDTERFLRTGDLGFLSDGELVVTGRLKDLIIINGRNYHAEDIEASSSGVHTALASCPSAAFSIERGTHTSAVLVQEIPRHTIESNSLSELARRIHSTVAEEREIILEGVVLVRSGSIPRTTSGKVKRKKCQELYLENKLDVLLEHSAGQAAEHNVTVANISVSGTEDEFLTCIQSIAARVLKCKPDEINIESTLPALGFDSLLTINLQTELETELGVQVPLDVMLGTVTLRALASQLPRDMRPGIAPDAIGPETPGVYPLSVGQRALFFIQLLSPGSSSYNLFSASRSPAGIDRIRFAAALNQILARHSLLRSIFVNTPSGPVREVLSSEQLQSFRETDASEWSAERLADYLHREANRPFDLTSGPPLRVELLRQRERGDVLLFVTHHIVADLWSGALFFEELAETYSADPDAVRLQSLTPAPPPYSSFVDRQLALLSAERQDHKDYWTEYLRDVNPLLNLPCDHFPEHQPQKGEVHWFELDSDLSTELERRASAEGVSLYTLLLTAYAALLLRVTGQDDILIGSPVAGRHSATDARTIGYFANQIVLRARWNANTSFKAFLNGMKADVASALANQDYPFSSLVEALGVKRDAHRLPLTQTLFGFHNTEHMHGVELSGFALGRAGSRFTRGALSLETIPIENAGAQSELTLFMAKEDNRLFGLFQYDLERFERHSIERISRQLITLLQAVARDTDWRLLDLPILDRAEQQHLLVDWNQTQSKYDAHPSIPSLVTAQAKRSPGQRAVTAYNGTLTYGELVSRMTVIGSVLRDKNARQDSVVALHCSRSTHLLVGMLGILESCAAFLPIDLALPVERIAYMVTTAGVQLGIADSQESEVTLLAAGVREVVRVELSIPNSAISTSEQFNNVHALDPSRLAYVIFTSGSTGKPKGVMITHRNLANFFHAMSTPIECDPGDRFYALTSISFDISILELLWPLTRGAEVALIPEQHRRGNSLLALGPQRISNIEFSLFYFADAPDHRRSSSYGLLLNGAKFADDNGFAAVWTPERHFHPFGGLYPNPAVTSAALAVSTRNVRIRAGSVVLPLHSPIRIAEEWSVVDNLSHGRVEIAFASGWHADDFALAPENFRERREIMLEGIKTIRQLWSGKKISAQNGNGKPIDLEVFPKPLQPELPIWITASGTPATFELAGSLGANVLTHLLGQSVEDVANNIALYREARAKSGHDPLTGRITLMLHSYLDETLDKAREIAREPFKQYLRSSVGLIERFIQTMGLPADLSKLTEADMDALLTFAAQRYFGTSALFGTVESCVPLVEKLIDIGVNEVACLIDFGIAPELALKSLEHICTLMRRFQTRQETVVEETRKRRTLLQCTPSMMKLLLAEDDEHSPLCALDTLLLGGEPLPAPLIEKVKTKYGCRIVNMYGPTETTIWSTIQSLEGSGPVKVGKPIANTQCFILDGRRLPVPIGSVGELYIGGDGVAKGYIGRADLTAERFIPNPFTSDHEGRLYRTGDLARYDSEGRIEILGRADFQVKVRGHRIELPEIETLLSAYPAIQDAAVVKVASETDDYLVGYFVTNKGTKVSAEELREFLQKDLPSYMIPSQLIQLDTLPLLTSGKVDRKTLESRSLTPIPEIDSTPSGISADLHLEEVVQEIWQDVLRKQQVGLDDNFFDIGGDSLRMVQVHTALAARLGRHFPLIKLLENPTIRQLATSIGSDTPDSTPASVSHSELNRAQLQRRSAEAMRRAAEALRTVAS